MLQNEETHSKWKALRDEYFGDREVIIVANRAPVTFTQSDEGHFTYRRGAGGLVTALLGLTQHLKASWIGCARTDADLQWGQGEIELHEERYIAVKFIHPDPQAYDQYYNTISNPLLWFIQHSMWDLPRAPIINRKTWDAWEDGYKHVNRMFADAVAEQVKTKANKPVVLLQDYHLYLSARYLREQLRRSELPTIMHFIHIPWPGPEYWRILPPTMRQAILDGLSAVDIMGFQTAEDGINFIRTVESYLPGVSVNYKRHRIWYRNHSTYIRDFPISIDVESLQELAKSDQVADYREQILQETGDKSLIVRIDRVEPSKNILRGYQAYEEFLELYPQFHGKVKFLAYLMPSRLEVGEYQDYLDELMAAAGRVNARFGNGEWEPIRMLVSENLPRAVAALQLYDVLLVNSIADGMNLVAKEGPVVNQCDGMLILSERTGARQQLAPGAIVISPCDVYATAEAMYQALTMSEPLRHENAERLRWLIEREDITAWLLSQFMAVKELGL
jgi:trehalose 6-phosphate synthase